jgi:hypothetical protein
MPFPPTFVFPGKFVFLIHRGFAGFRGFGALGFRNWFPKDEFDIKCVAFCRRNSILVYLLKTSIESLDPEHKRE